MSLLEREHPLQALAAALDQVERGAGRLALVAGEAGIGKTSLVEHFATLHRERAATLWGACDALYTPTPLGPLRDIAGAIGGELLRDLEAKGDRHTLFSTLLRTLSDRPRPAILVIEDAHWADEATLDLVKFLGRRIARVRALFIVTYRDDEVGVAHPLRSVLGELPRESTLRVPVERLSETAVLSLARAARREGEPANLFEITGGNPFFVTEILASLEGGLPATVRDAVLARTLRLSATARSALEVVSQSPVPVEAWLLDACVPDATQAVEECIGRGMLRPMGDGYAFRHELARLAVGEWVSPSRRAELARRMLAALRARPVRPEMLARLAHHADAAGDTEAVLTFARAAGAHAAQLGSHREAVAHYGRALPHLRELPDADQAQIHEGHARECHATGDMEGAIAGFTTASEIRRRIGQPFRQGEDLCRMMSSYIGAGRDDGAYAVTRAAIELLEPLGKSRELALAYRTQAALHMFQRDNAQAIEWGEKAVALAGDFGDMEIVVASLNAIGSALLLAGDEAKGVEVLEQSLALARDAGMEDHILNAYGNLGSASGEIYRFPQAERYLVAGIERATEHDRDHSRLYGMSWLALAYLHQGRWNAAGDTALAVLKSRGAASISRIMALLAIGRLRTRRGDPGATEALDEALKLARKTGTLQRLGPVAGARAEAAWLAGDPELAKREAQSAFALARAKAHPWFVGELAYWQWKAGAGEAAPAEAAEPFRTQIEGRPLNAAALWRERKCPYEAARALAESDDEPALKEALQQFEQLGAQPAAERVRQHLRERGARGIPRGPRAATRANAFGLTSREIEIVALLAERLTNAEIASRLHRSEKTIDHHVSAVLAKLEVRTREDAVAAARAHGMLAK